MRILTENLIAALNIAINSQSKIEKEEWGYTNDSAFVGGLKQVVEAAESGEEITVKDS
jgi:hypothetical protein